MMVSYDRKEDIFGSQQRDEIFHITQRVDESLEDYLEIFQFSCKCATKCKLVDE